MRLQGKVALVTGGGSGIGRAVARRFADEGASVCVADLRPEAARAVADEVKAAGGRAIVVDGDVAEPEAAERFVRATLDAFGHLDILANIAGITIRKSLEATTLDDWNRLMATNLTGVFLCTKYAVEPMKRQRSGRIINMASISGQIGLGYSSYCASKGGVIALTRELVGELSSFGITVNAIAPGVIQTPINERTLALPEVRRAIERAKPLGRLGRPEDIAAVAVFLASDDAGFVTGHVLVADGGMTAVVTLSDAGDAYLRFDERPA